MNLKALVERCRITTGDLTKKYLWSDQEWIDALNEACDEACIRARLI